MNIINFDLPYLRTSKLLLSDPSKVTNSYINGLRKSISPPSKYLILTLGLFGIFQLLFPNFYIDLYNKNNLFLEIYYGFSDGISMDGISEKECRQRRDAV